VVFIHHFLFFIASFFFATRDQALTFEKFKAELLNFETLLTVQPESNTFALYTTKPSYHIGSSSFSNPSTCFILKHILHCPSTSANLLSIHKCYADNDCFFILTNAYFLVKDNKTRTTLLQDPSEDGLYPIHLSTLSTNKRRSLAALLGVRTSSSVWHFRLGNPSNQLVFSLIRSHHLPIIETINCSNVCDSCQLAKSKQLPSRECLLLLLS
jgi:hypothetical protein